MYICRPRHLLGLIFVIILYGCAARTMTPDVSVAKDVHTNVTGVWQGRSFAMCPLITTNNPGRCSAMQRITLTLFQDGQRVTGFYKCAFGNEECRGLAENGVIRDGHMGSRLLQLRVMLDDDSMCRFTGMPVNGVLEGRYQCHWGGPAEWGGFRVERSY
jgi:hypothetical protein